MKVTIYVLFVSLFIGCATTSQTSESSIKLQIKYFRTDGTSLPITEGYVLNSVDTCTFPPSLVQKVKPDYLPIAVRAGVEGNVIVRVFVNALGHVYKSQIVRTDAELFNKDAIDAAMQWTFAPYMEKCAKAEFVAEIPMHFRLPNGRPTVFLP